MPAFAAMDSAVSSPSDALVTASPATFLKPSIRLTVPPFGSVARRSCHRAPSEPRLNVLARRYDVTALD